MHPKRRYANALTKGFKSGSPEILKKVSIELVPQMDFAKAFSKNLEKRIGICKKTKSIIPHNLIF